MTVITGTCAEARLYLYYVLAVLRPGVRVPTFGEPEEFDGSLAACTADEDFKIIIEESRRTLDRQETDLERIRSRATTLLTIGLAEIAVMSALAARTFQHGPLVAILWCSSGVTVILGIGGAASVLTSQARMGWVDLARSPPAHRRSYAAPPTSMPSSVAQPGTASSSAWKTTLRRADPPARGPASAASISIIPDGQMAAS